MNRFKKGDIAWANTNEGWVQVKVLQNLGNYYQVKKINKNSAFGVSSNRLITESEYNEKTNQLFELTLDLQIFIEFMIM